MKCGLALLLLVVCAQSCPAQQALPAWDDNARNAWWTRNSTPDSWTQAAKDLQAQLEAAYKQNGSSAFSNSDFEAWLDHLVWIDLGLECPEVLAEPANLQTFVALGKDDAVSHLFVEKMAPRDVKKQALLNLLHLAQANLDDLNEYAALGVAYSLVFDQPFPEDWPHHQVKKEAVPIGDLDVVQRFNFYVQANRDKKTDQDLTQLTFEQLKFLVDSEVSLTELSYAQKNRIPYSHFDGAFFSINYDYSRIKPPNFAYDWALATYNLADIEKNGGICVDQAYYAVTIGKGRGIPTIYFTGVGSGGGHAWFGYLSRSGKWELDCGRYADQNFPKGFAVDPQTWQRIDDATLNNLFKTDGKDSNYQPAMTGLAWARLHEGGALYRQILDDVRGIMPEWAGTWRLEGLWLNKSNAELDQVKAFYQQWITQFQSFPEMKFEGQWHLLDALKRAHDPDAESLQQSMVLANRTEGFDMGIASSASSISDKLKAQDWDGAKLEFQKAIRDFGDQGGGTLYLNIIVPYIQVCLKNNRIDQADSGIRFVRDRIPMDPTSQIGLEFADLKDAVDRAKKNAAQASPSLSP